MTTPSIEIQIVQQNTGHRQPPTSLKSRLEALLAPLQRLDQRLQQSLEVRQTLLGTPFEPYLLGGIEPGCSPAGAIAKHSPLAQLQRSFELSNFEIEVVLMAIAPELDRRYERLYARLQPDACRRPTQQLSLDVLCRSVEEKEVARTAFSPTAPLIRSGLVHLKANGSFSLNPTASRHLLGQPMGLQLSTFCQLSWPKSTGYITNSSSLSSLLERISQGKLSTPLTLNFSGQGKTASAANAIAAATHCPLLTVDLGEVLSGKLSDTEIVHKIQQVALQGRLWNAVLYLTTLDDSAALQSRWFSSAIASPASRQNAEIVHRLLNQLSGYPGIVIFSAQSISSLVENSYKEIVTVPFTEPYPKLSGIDPSFLKDYWEKTQKAVPASFSKSLSETEWFRQKEAGAALGLS